MPLHNQSEYDILNSIFIAGSSIFGSTFHVALSKAAPGDDGLAFDEPLEASGYGRVQNDAGSGNWNEPAKDGSVHKVTNKNELSFGTASADWGTISHFAIFDRDIATHAVAAVNTGSAGAASFEVATDITGQLTAGDLIRVRDSTGNDGVYTIRSGSSFSSPNTTINVEEAISDGTVDGNLDLLGLMIVSGAWDASKAVQNGDPAMAPAGSMEVTSN